MFKTQAGIMFAMFTTVCLASDHANICELDPHSTPAADENVISFEETDH